MTGRLVTPASRALCVALVLVTAFAVVLVLQLLAAGPAPLPAELDHAAGLVLEIVAAMLLPQTGIDLALVAALVAAVALSALAPRHSLRRAGDVLGISLLPLYFASNLFQVFQAGIAG